MYIIVSVQRSLYFKSEEITDSIVQIDVRLRDFPIASTFYKPSTINKQHEYFYRAVISQLFVTVARLTTEHN